MTVGLIGLHIAQKTPSRPQWIWSSFEQVDAVPPKWADWPGTFALNDATGAPMPEQNPLSLAPLAPEPVRPFNVVRAADAPILTATELTSYGYRHLLAGTPWQYYRLVVTQWPRLEGNQADPIPAQRGWQRREHVPRLRRVLGVRERHDGDLRSERRAARVHELPQSRAHDHGLHVERDRSCVSAAPRARAPAMNFGEHVALLREFLDRRQEIVEQIERLCCERTGARTILDSCFSPDFRASCPDFKGQLAASHLADGFEPIALEGSSHDFDPVELIARAHQHWERHRWPGRNVRLRYAERLYSVFILRQLEHLSLRIWDEGDDGAADRLQEIQVLLDRLNDGTIADALVRDARWLIQTAQGPLTRRLEPYFRIAERISASFTDSRRLEIHKAGARLTSGHLRSQLRHRASETDRPIDDPDVLAITRNSNSMDAALLVRDLVPLLEAYGTACAGDAPERLTLADAILQAVSADPELLLTRLDLLGPCTMIEDLFIQHSEGGQPRYTPKGEAHRQLLESYAGLIGRHAESLQEDARSLDPRHGVYSPLGIAYGFCADILSNMALDTLLAQPAFGLTLEDMFASRGSLENKRARARRLDGRLFRRLGGADV